MTTGIGDHLMLHSLLESPAVSGAVDAIVEQVRAASASISEVRGPDPQRQAAYRKALDRQGAAKGRAPLYPYVGSGLGNGPLVQLADGSVKWDMINGIGVYAFGHSDPDLIATAIRAAASDVLMQGNLQFDEAIIEFAEALLSEARQSSRLEHCFVINSGALANESALKVCFQHNAPADRILAYEGCFAGRTMAMCQITDSAAGREGLPADLKIDYVPFYDQERPEESSRLALARLKQHLERYPGRHACFTMELVQGEGGFNAAPREFFLPLMELCREQSVGVWVDEIQTFGRTPQLYCFDHLALGDVVDVVTIGKLSQACACLFTADYNPKAGLLSATFAGSTVGLRVGRRVVRRLVEGDYYGTSGRIAGLQTEFRARMKRLVEKRKAWFPPVALRDGRTTQKVYDGIGGMCRLTPFGGDRQKIQDALNAMFAEGLVAFYCGRGPYHIRFLLPIGIMEPSHFDGVFEVLERGLARIA